MIHSKRLSCLNWSTTKQTATFAKRKAFGDIFPKSPWETDGITLV
jgi:hypothetical protein